MEGDTQPPDPPAAEPVEPVAPGPFGFPPVPPPPPAAFAFPSDPFGQPPPRGPRRTLLLAAIALVAVIAVVAAVALAGGNGGSSAARSPAPSPTGVTAVPTLTATATSPIEVDLSWPAASSNVEEYTLFRDGTELATQPNSITTYTDTSVSPSHRYTYAVEAIDQAGHQSSQTAAMVSTPAPPAAALGRLQGQFVIHGKFTSESFTNKQVGQVETFTWIFTPVCSAGPCPARLNTFAEHQSVIVLKRSRNSYAGKGTAMLVSCGSTRLATTLTVSLHATRARYIDRQWRATALAGTFTESAGATFSCAAGGSTQALTGSLTG
jgi:hypothetical protein